ncbi:retropepsin-like aspartic protease family protein [Oceanicoccus sagamiensis]|uniref:Aspartyl protease n=1 Tax=Oceanicoccus sagamiensis TaxID=716816 RepID=A0A1X9N9B6_9GAMM|nr:TIGR02281 family clan AA aspartic protease [Oceanicoccus sagamiensis]ARN73022.1 hypothetical protein BST96_02210 [Oceanicoccus sagamiensis]
MNSSQDNTSPRKMGITMFILAWAILFIMGIVFFDDLLATQINPNRKPDSRTTLEGTKEIVLQSNQQHHYVANGLINGHKTVFLLDTGATDVVIPQSLAQKIGLKASGQQQAYTANGRVTVYRTTLASLQIGDIKLQDINASINPAMDKQVVLLGMSALKRLEFTQRGETLILRQYDD